MKQKAALLLFLFICGKSVFAQMPETDIWLFDIQQNGESFSFSNGVNFTNRPGYDNQPSFSPDSKSIYYTSYRDGQSDIYRYDISTQTTKQFCKTLESEYSPCVTPDGKFVSVVMVEKDSTQRLWKFPIQGGPPILVMKNTDSIGYYCWTDLKNLLLFRLGNPEKLYEANTDKDRRDWSYMVTKKPGRILLSDSLHNGYYVNKNDSAQWFIAVEFKNTEPLAKCGIITGRNLIQTLPGKEDFCIWKNRVLFMGNNSSLYFSPFTVDGFGVTPVTSWKAAGMPSESIHNISRIAISPDGKKIAIVSTL